MRPLRVKAHQSFPEHYSGVAAVTTHRQLIKSFRSYGTGMAICHFLYLSPSPLTPARASLAARRIIDFPFGFLYFCRVLPPFALVYPKLMNVGT